MTEHWLPCRDGDDRARGLYRRHYREHHPLILPTLDMLEQIMGARHRLFATNWPWFAPGHPRHQNVIARGRGIGARASTPALESDGRPRSPGRHWSPAGNLARAQAEHDLPGWVEWTWKAKGGYGSQ